MILLVKLIGIYLTALGLSFLLRPEILKRVTAFISKENRIHVVGMLRIFLGLLLYFASPECSNPIAINVLGILIVLKGMVTLTLDLAKIKSILTWWEKRPAWVVRIMSLIVVGIGVLIIYSA